MHKATSFGVFEIKKSTEAQLIPVSFQLKYSVENNEEKVNDVRLQM